MFEYLSVLDDSLLNVDYATVGIAGNDRNREVV